MVVVGAKGEALEVAVVAAAVLLPPAALVVRVAEVP